jgi:Bax protein
VLREKISADNVFIKKAEITSTGLIPFFLLFFILFLAPEMPFAQNPVQKYIDKYKDMATRMMEKHGIPVSVILGIAIHESGSGTSKNCVYLHNHFGMIAGKGKKQTPAGFASFYRYFETDSLSYEHFAQYIINRKFYPKLKGDMDYRKWLNAIGSAGYSANKQRWVGAVSLTIRRFKLADLDQKK